MKSNKFTHVKIQGKWLRASIIHTYSNGSVWYSLVNNGGAGWVDEKYKVKVKQKT